ncbi:mismatch-specific DNA-glycosylase [Deinococcus rubellus]|uniref:Mismatch-specific DNA-glycosylase n=1 Tax=Deinococcus rubellus TaxID=1889240 RepID=A0ABY5YE14_9DEIO|nr:mismatch-specific DNA-glycosylase [Deinococcus rubellus]UWX62956.1 mismatch-specific DNA-glycosylase [Deinococcus rubellus]
MSATATTESLLPPSGEGHLVPDLLAPGLRLVLIGTAPSRISARAGAYYANPQNKFWRVLAEVELTPRLFAPQEFPALLALGIGLTDVAKKHSGVDASLPTEAWEPDELRARLAHYRPEVVAFTSKRGASQVLGVPTGRLSYGLQPGLLEGAEVWVLPSTSPLGHNYFQLGPWQALARRVGACGNSRRAEGVL